MLTELWRIVMFNYNMLFCLLFRRSNSDGYIRSPIFDDTARFLKKLEKMSALARAARNLRGYGRYYQAKWVFVLILDFGGLKLIFKL